VNRRRRVFALSIKDEKKCGPHARWKFAPTRRSRRRGSPKRPFSVRGRPGKTGRGRGTPRSDEREGTGHSRNPCADHRGSDLRRLCPPYRSRASADTQGVVAPFRAAPFPASTSCARPSSPATGNFKLKQMEHGTLRASGIHGSHRRSHPGNGLPHQTRGHSRYGVPYAEDSVPEVRRHSAGKLSQVQMPEMRFFDLESRVEPRVAPE